MTQRTRLISYLFYGHFSVILKMNKIKKPPEVIFKIREQEVIRSRVPWTDRNLAMRSKFLRQWEILDLSLRSIKTNYWWAEDLQLSPRYSHVTLISGYLFWQLLIDYNVNVHYYQVKHRPYMPWTQVMPGHYKKILPALQPIRASTIVAI